LNVAIASSNAVHSPNNILSEDFMTDTFYDTFLDKLDALESRAKAVGITMTHICRDCGISRATPDRWRNAVPRTIEIIDQMEEVVRKAEEAAAAPQ
jgi:hypothetical protein